MEEIKADIEEVIDENNPIIQDGVQDGGEQ